MVLLTFRTSFRAGTLHVSSPPSLSSLLFTFSHFFTFGEHFFLNPSAHQCV